MQNASAPGPARVRVLLSQVKASLRTSDCPIHFSDTEADTYLSSVGLRTSELLASMPQDTVVNGVANLVCQGGADWAAQQITSKIIVAVAAAMTTDAAIDVAEAGGATITAATAGAAGGSFLGPVGTASGVIVGLGIGFATDWWISGKLQVDLENRCNSFLDKLEREIVDGSPSSTGLRNDLTKAIAAANQIQLQAMQKTLDDTEAKR